MWQSQFMLQKISHLPMATLGPVGLARVGITIGIIHPATNPIPTNNVRSHRTQTFYVTALLGEVL